MENVRLFLLSVISQVEAAESGIRKRAVVVTRFVASQRRDRINSNAELIMGIGLEERQGIRIQFAGLGKIVRIANLCQPRPLLLAGQPRQIVNFLRVDSLNITPDFFREWSALEKL